MLSLISGPTLIIHHLPSSPGHPTTQKSALSISSTFGPTFWPGYRRHGGVRIDGTALCPISRLPALAPVPAGTRARGPLPVSAPVSAPAFRIPGRTLLFPAGRRRICIAWNHLPFVGWFYPLGLSAVGYWLTASVVGGSSTCNVALLSLVKKISSIST